MSLCSFNIRTSSSPMLSGEPRTCCSNMKAFMCSRACSRGSQHLGRTPAPTADSSTKQARGCCGGAISRAPSREPTNTSADDGFVNLEQSAVSSTSMKAAPSTPICEPKSRALPTSPAGAWLAIALAAASLPAAAAFASRRGSSTSASARVGAARVASQSMICTFECSVTLCVLCWGFLCEPSPSARSMPSSSRRTPPASIASRQR
mmetsp:Transcript_9240/g.28720  ORF Transcript_9240/g.28720 Transcript_9240/m.28720 type:complete len:206 (-) Transcript_9240:652-1269(-)